MCALVLSLLVQRVRPVPAAYGAPGASRCGARGARRGSVAAGASQGDDDRGDPFAARAREHARSSRDMKAADRTAEWRAPNVAPEVLSAIRAEDDALRDMPESEWLRRERAERALEQGKPPRHLSAEHKQKISAAQKGRANNGHVMTPDHKAAISRGMRWMHANPEHKASRLAGAGRKRVCVCSRCGVAGHNVRTCTLPPLKADARPQRVVHEPEILE